MTVEFKMLNEQQRQKVAAALWRRERPTCQSGLVDDLLKRGGVDGFAWEDIANLTPDPSDWDLEKCRDYIRDRSNSFPEPDPWHMDRSAMVEALTDVDIECRDDEDDATLRAAVIANIDDGTIDGLDDWREAVQDIAEPEEVYEWWEVGGWLAERLEEAGEVVLRNGYGDWWGRCTTGQSVSLDYIIQKLGAEYAAWALDEK